MTFGQKLKALRQARGMTQPGLADASGVSVGTIRDYEQGRRDPLLSNAHKLAIALGVTVNELVTDNGPAPKKKGGGKKGGKK